MIIRQSHILTFWVGITLCLASYLVWQGWAWATDQEQPLASPLIINELMVSNGGGLSDEDGDLVDWIEIYNQSPEAINLETWTLTDDLTQTEKWYFPARVLDPDQYLVVFASGKDRRPSVPELNLHTNFRLEKNGESIALTNQDKLGAKETFSLEYPQQWRFIAYGWQTGSEKFVYSPEPSPGQANNDTSIWPTVIPELDFSHTRGFYDTPFQLSLASPDPEAIIRFTTDGSRPNETNGTLYQQPIDVTTTTIIRAAGFRPGHLTPQVSTHTYLFIDDVLDQADLSPVLVEEQTQSLSLREALADLPALSLVSEDDSYYIYAHAWQKGREWERPVSIELIPPPTTLTQDPGFQIDAGIRMNGKGGRSLNKISFRLFFRGIYGATKLTYPLFPDSAVQSFETLVLRGGGNRNYTNDRMTTAFLQDATYTRDQWLRESQLAMSGYGSHGRFVHLFLNGWYWGLYNLVERPDAAFSAAYFGGQEQDWHMLKPDGSSQGDETSFLALQSLVESGTLSDPHAFAEVQRYLKTAEFADYMILHWYAGMRDWPHSNWYMSGRPSDGQIRYFAWDGEETWVGDGANIHFGGDHPSFINDLFQTLIQNPEFQLEFADRLYQHTQDQGALSDASSQARWQRVNLPIEKAIKAEIARWGLIRHERAEPEWWLQEPQNFIRQISNATNRWNSLKAGDEAVNYEHWVQARDRVAQEMQGNGDKLITLAREQGYYPSIDPPMIKLVSEPENPTRRITIIGNNIGPIYFTLDGSDPRETYTGKPSKSGQIFSEPLPLSQIIQIKARLLKDGEWSPLAVWPASDFEKQYNQSPIIISQIMYNPIDGSDYEFITLKNTGDYPIDLSGAYFEGIRYQFPLHSSLSEGESTTLVRNLSAMKARYPAMSIAGVYQGNLSNDGEKIALKGSGGQILFSVTYDDENNWPLSPDGKGDLLAFSPESGSSDAIESWRAKPPPTE
ncbi:MAG: lamin tail domain-containing protein [Chloroflexota bacterium]